MKYIFFIIVLLFSANAAAQNNLINQSDSKLAEDSVKLFAVFCALPVEERDRVRAELADTIEPHIFKIECATPDIIYPENAKISATDAQIKRMQATLKRGLAVCESVEMMHRAVQLKQYLSMLVSPNTYYVKCNYGE